MQYLSKNLYNIFLAVNIMYREKEKIFLNSMKYVKCKTEERSIYRAVFSVSAEAMAIA